MAPQAVRDADALMPLIYDELRALAARYMRSEAPGHTLQATALVHEAYVQLAEGKDHTWQNRAHFLGTAATVVRRLLVQHARSRNVHKRGGGWRRVAIDVGELSKCDTAERVLFIDEALRRLADVDGRKARLVELRFFAGLTIDEAADALGLSPRSAARDWALARAWLTRELNEGQRA